MGVSDGRYGGALSAVVNGLRDVVRSRRQGETNGRQLGRRRSLRGVGERMDGAWCLVTGASSGLGFETAVRLIERGANLVVASRSAGPELVRRLRERAAARNEPAIEAITLDLANLASVEAFVDEIARRGHRLDVVVFNAGVVRVGARTTTDGFDEMLQVNYLANHAGHAAGLARLRSRRHRDGRRLRRVGRHRAIAQVRVRLVGGASQRS